MAGRLQLATKGTQDIFFTENPEYTHFIKNFRKHTNFAKYEVKHDLDGNLEYGSTLRCTIPNNCGDLIKNVSVQFELPHLTFGTTSPVTYTYIESIGHVLIEYVDLIIGGQVIQRVPADWLQIHSENYITQTKQTNLSKLIGKCPDELSGTNVSSVNIEGYLGNATTPRKCIVDIPFYFYNNSELALPLCALTKQECEIEIKLNNRENCITDLPTHASPNNTTFNVVESGTTQYIIDGIVHPTLTLIKGNTYNFTYDKTGHPFALRETDGVTPYTNGLSSATDPASFTVPLDAPDTLEYYCTQHPSSMKGTINLISPGIYDVGINSMSLQTEMVQLGDPERVKYQSEQVNHIITQLQVSRDTIPANTNPFKHRTEFINPVKELFFVIKRVSVSNPFDYDHPSQILNDEYISYENLRSLEMTLDGETVLNENTGKFINLRAVQSGIHHSRTQLFRRFYSYSFALEPERWYPTGQRNFSMINNQDFKFDLNTLSEDRELRVYALSNNILEFKDGVAKLRFNSGKIGN